MGIPFYFRKLLTIFGKQILQPIRGGGGKGKKITCDSLYLDFNSIIHMSAAQVVDFFSEERVIEKVIENTLYIAHVVSARRVVLAVDGLCPRAKMAQQRKRRYMTAWRKYQEGQTSSWDTNAITPGTAFMRKLDTALAAFSQNASCAFEVLVSPSSEPGEGEQKIFDMMVPGETAIIYGLDADLLMLSMISSNSDNIRLLRDSPEFGPKAPATPYSMLSIKELKASVGAYFKDDRPEFIKDYVMLASLLGNDFVPPLSYLQIKEHGIEMVVSAYVEARLDDEERIVTPEGGLNLALLHRVIRGLAAHEIPRMTEACASYHKHIDARKGVDSYPSRAEHKFPLSIPSRGWQEVYYARLVLASPSLAAAAYHEMLTWIHAYYFTRNASMTQYYPYAYSPLCVDLVEAHHAPPADQRREEALADDLKTMQLLLVLPPSSAHLLPESLRFVMTDPHAITHYMYPTQFNIQTFLKTFLWECSPSLPPIDLDLLRQTVLSQSSK